MRFLICLRGQKLSRQTLHFGALMASRLGTDITVLYVAPGTRRSFWAEARIAREKMNEWAMDSPGNEVLRAARDHLMGLGLIRSGEDDDQFREVMVPGEDGSLELQRVGVEGAHVAFRFREGDALEQILAELRARHHEVLVIGAGPGRGGLTPRLLQFSSSSVLIVKNPRDIRYKILVATDATPPAHRAELLAIKTASYLGMELTFLSVVGKKVDRQFMGRHLERMAGLCKLKRVAQDTVIATGNVADRITAAAGDDHIVFLGSSRRGALRKLLFGSKTIDIAAKTNCPLLVVK